MMYGMFSLHPAPCRFRIGPRLKPFVFGALTDLSRRERPSNECHVCCVHNTSHAFHANSSRSPQKNTANNQWNACSPICIHVDMHMAPGVPLYVRHIWPCVVKYIPLKNCVLVFFDQRHVACRRTRCPQTACPLKPSASQLYRCGF